METRFILPATVATALHLLVFYIPKTPVDGVTIEPAVTTVDLGNVPSVIDELPEPPETPDKTEEAVKSQKGEPESYLPTLEEPPPRVSPFEQARAPINPHPDIVVDRIPGGPIGDPLGDIEGHGRSPILSSRLLDGPPRTRSQVAPNYPPDARTLGLTGEVMVEFVIDESGRVLTARVVRSSDSRFEAATLRAVERWRFEPGKKNGRPVRFRMVAPVVFSLDT